MEYVLSLSEGDAIEIGGVTWDIIAVIDVGAGRLFELESSVATGGVYPQITVTGEELAEIIRRAEERGSA